MNDFNGFPAPNTIPIPTAFFELMHDIDDMGELKVTLIVIRYTFGFNRKSARLSERFFVRAGIKSRSTVQRGIKKALERNTIYVTKPGNNNNPTEYGLRILDDQPELLELKSQTYKARSPRQAKPAQPENGSLQSEMMSALATATGMDLKLNAGSLASNAKDLLTAGYKPADVLAHFTGEDCFWRHDWRGKNSAKPNIANIRQMIRVAVKTETEEIVIDG